jgi:hypothetical protein
VVEPLSRIAFKDLEIFFHQFNFTYPSTHNVLCWSLCIKHSVWFLGKKHLHKLSFQHYLRASIWKLFGVGFIRINELFLLKLVHIRSEYEQYCVQWWIEILFHLGIQLLPIKPHNIFSVCFNHAYQYGIEGSAKVYF